MIYFNFYACINLLPYVDYPKLNYFSYIKVQVKEKAHSNLGLSYAFELIEYLQKYLQITHQ